MVQDGTDDYLTALRLRADQLVGDELRRLCRRCPDLTDPQRAEIARSVRAVVRALLPAPPPRAARRTAPGDGELVRRLFDLPPVSTDG